MIATNIPALPKLAIGKTKPTVPAASKASAGILTGVKVSKKAVVARIPPESPSSL